MAIQAAAPARPTWADMRRDASAYLKAREIHPDATAREIAQAAMGRYGTNAWWTAVARMRDRKAGV